MKRLTTTPPRRLAAAKGPRPEARAAAKNEQAQCCAKVSKIVVGCHD